jgi:2-iminobutanoate/2-iminopropanoate deaminase
MDRGAKRCVFPSDSPPPVGPYSPAIQIGDLFLISGQVPRDAATGQIITGSIAEQTHSMMENVSVLLDAAGLDFSNIVKTTVFLADISSFSSMNEVYGSYFQEPYPARSTVEVSALPLGAQMEIDVIAVRFPFGEQEVQQ